jgi:hypothetical protein
VLERNGCDGLFLTRNGIFTLIIHFIFKFIIKFMRLMLIMDLKFIYIEMNVIPFLIFDSFITRTKILNCHKEIDLWLEARGIED